MTDVKRTFAMDAAAILYLYGAAFIQPDAAWLVGVFVWLALVVHFGIAGMVESGEFTDAIRDALDKAHEIGSRPWWPAYDIATDALVVTGLLCCGLYATSGIYVIVCLLKSRTMKDYAKMKAA